MYARFVTLSHWQRAASTQKYASTKLTRVDVNRSETAVLMEAILRAHDCPGLLQLSIKTTSRPYQQSSACRREKTFNFVVTFSRYSGRHGIAKGRKAYPHAFLPERRYGPKFETAIRYARPRQTREIARLSRLVEELQSQVARFAFRSCLVCGKPFRAGRADASTCSARCRTRLCRHRRKGGPQT
jgi:hypothetical protein